MANLKIRQIEINGTVYDIDVDLSNYPTTTEMNNAIQTAINNITDGDEVEY